MRKINTTEGQSIKIGKYGYGQFLLVQDNINLF